MSSQLFGICCTCITCKKPHPYVIHTLRGVHNDDIINNDIDTIHNNNSHDTTTNGLAMSWYCSSDSTALGKVQIAISKRTVFQSNDDRW